MKQNKKILAAFLLAAIIASILLGMWYLDRKKDVSEIIPIQEQETIIIQEEKALYESENKPASEVKNREIEEPEAIQRETQAAYVPDAVDKSPENIGPQKELVCTLSVRCDDVLKHIDMLSEAKRSIVPPNGVIFQEQTITFLEGDSIFDVLLREMKNKGIHLEFVNTPMYNSAYIEGIGNLYEFDCGDTSGWMYKVNGSKPTYGCSQYKLKSGDRIEFFYQCSMFE